LAIELDVKLCSWSAPYSYLPDDRHYKNNGAQNLDPYRPPHPYLHLAVVGPSGNNARDDRDDAKDHWESRGERHDVIVSASPDQQKSWIAPRQTRLDPLADQYLQVVPSN